MASTSNSDLLPADESRNWLELPTELMASILQRVGTIDILTSAQNVCTTWRRICKDSAMWRVIDIRCLGDSWEMDFDLEKMARHAVDLSCGELVDLNMEYFGSDELLQYISDRSSQLRRIRLVCCYSISNEGLGEMVKKLPLLEELHLYYIRISKQAIEFTGRFCPLLKSFKLNNLGYRYPQIECDEEALAIADNMPGLRHLQLFGNKLTNAGLLAILGNCHHLESLDLRQCFNVKLGADLGKRCSEQVRDLRRPFDSTEDYGFDAEIHDWDSFEEEYPSGLSDIDIVSDYDDSYVFSGGSGISDNDYHDDEGLFDD